MTDRPDLTLVATGVGGGRPGGLFALSTAGVDAIDRISSTGLAISDDGQRAARLLWTDDDPQGAGELVIYDARGARAYHRIDELREPHSALWDGDQLLVVSTLDDAVLWLDAAGQVTRRWTANGGGDCWHLNCLARDGDRLVLSAFGRFDTHRGWAAAGARAGAGIVVDLERGETLIDGLNAPHDPTFVDGRWLICNSGEGELLATDARGTPVARVALGGWTRGLAVGADEIHVGVSANRHNGPQHGGASTARIITLDRRTLQPLRELALPCEEVFALRWMDAALLEGVRVGFAGNRLRAAEPALLASGFRGEQPVSDRDGDVRVRISEVPAEAVAGRWFAVIFAARNDGPATLHSAGSYPVLIGARWTRADGDGDPLGEFRAQLSRPLIPGSTGLGRLYVQAPAEAGEYRLHVAALQEHVRWFNEGLPERGDDHAVAVIARSGVSSPAG